jgi:hypothetical protein
VTGSVHRILIGVGELSESAEEGRQQRLGVAAPREVDPPRDERRRVLEHQYNFPGPLENVQREVGGVTVVEHQEHRQMVAAQSRRIEHGPRIDAAVFFADVPVKDDRTKRRV